MMVESRRNRRGEVVGMCQWRMPFLEQYVGLLPDQAGGLQSGQHWTVGDTRYEVVAMRRCDVLEWRWELLFRLMEVLQSRIEDADLLRWVVWFSD